MLMNVVTVRIKEVAQERGLMTAYQLQKATGAQPSLAAKWYRNDLKSIAIDTLDTLCRTLDCTPNDLLRYEPEQAEK
jgi:DNA-binding Xre family transcriptional regulator